MSFNWRPLQDELQLWQREGLRLPVWWRDDDAITVTPQLEQLTEMANALGLAVHLAVIPRDAEPLLAQYAAANPMLVPVVHGWAHQNHAPTPEKKSEFGLHRAKADIANEASEGLSRLHGMFKSGLCPMFVPPWNRIAPEVIATLPAHGYRILSTATPRKARMAAPGLEKVNTHLDPIDWHGTRGLADPDALIGQTAALLKDRRKGRTDNTEPFGVLTHHLVHDDDIWTFTQRLLTRLLDGPGFAWSAPEYLKNQGDFA